MPYKSSIQWDAPDHRIQEDMCSSQNILQLLCERTSMQYGMIRKKTDDHWHSWCTYDNHDNQLDVENRETYNTVYKNIRDGTHPIFIQDIDRCENTLWQKTLGDFDLKSYISFPILDKNRTVLGHLSFMDYGTVRFDLAKLETLLPIFGDLIALDFLTVSKKRSIREKLRQEQELSRNREIMLSTLAHDINNPLSSISIQAQYLGAKIKDKKLKRIASNILQASRRVMGNVADILDFSAIRFGNGLAGKKEPVHIDHLIAQVIGELGDHQQRLKVPRMDLPVPVECNRHKIGRAICNLITNALRHGISGRDIGIEAYLSEENLVFSVENETKPICPSTLDSFFRPFVRGANSTGLGLGLYITKEIAVMHSGKIDVELNEGKVRIRMLIPLCNVKDGSS